MSDNKIAESQGRALFNEYISENFDDNNLLSRFDRLTELYNEVNSVINISAIRNIDDIYVKHYLDSVYAAKYFSGKCCDVGCGGGFPCLPLAIVTGLRFDGIESVGKKLTLIRRAAAENIVNVTPVHARAEEAAKAGTLYETVSARAVAEIDKVISFCAPLTAPNGKIVLYKTQNDSPASEKILLKYRLKLEKTENYNLPGTDIKRRLFIYRKE